MKIKFTIISIAFIICIPFAGAQVTIGSNEAPREASLLDLNQINDKEVRGLGLPRVELSSLSTLTIAAENKSNRDNHVGTMVFHTPNDNPNNKIKEGIYCWIGDRWKQAIVVNSKGKNGSILKSNGDGTYGWSEITFPDYKYHKPTNVGGMKKDNTPNPDHTYTFNQIVHTDAKSSYVWYPEKGIFDDRYVYIDTLTVMTGIETEKYMLLGLTVLTKKVLSGTDISLYNSVWESISVDVILTKINDNGPGTPVKIKSYTKTINTPSGGNPNGYLDLFSIIRFSNSTYKLEKGKYELKIRVLNNQHTFSYNTNDGGNKHNNTGNFYNGAPNSYAFYTIRLEDINFVLYEYD